MSRNYRLNAANRGLNALFRVLTKLGVGARYRHILTVRGRKTGNLHSTPIDVMEVDGRRFLVSPYGQVNWVKNVRAAGEVTLTRGRRTTRRRTVELSPQEAAPILRKYVSEVPVTRPYFDVKRDSSDEEFAGEAPRHPVFEVSQATEAESEV
jgi:deazaflavin-dependent oxidoreductase (nitroreductase family)